MSIAAPIAVLPIILLVSHPADGVANRYPFSLRSQHIYKGIGTASGNVTFPDARHARLQGSVTDHCPADGAGVYLSVGVGYRDGTGHFYRDFLKDDDGCGNGPSKFNIAAPNPDKKKISEVTVWLCVDNKSQPFWCQDRTLGPTMDNPNR